MKVKNAAWIPPHRHTHMQRQFYSIKMHKLLGLADTYTFILLSFSPLFPVRIPVNANKTASGMLCRQDALLKFLLGEQPLFLIMTPAWCNQTLESFRSALWLNPYTCGSAWLWTLHCNLKGHPPICWALLLHPLPVIYVPALSPPERWEIKVSGNSGSQCCDSQWEISLPINQQKCAVVIYSWWTYIQAVLTRRVFLCFWSIEYPSSSSLFLYFWNMRYLKTHSYYINILEISPVLSMKTRKCEGTNHKAPVVRTTTIPYFFFLNPNSEVFLQKSWRKQIISQNQHSNLPDFEKMLFSVAVW